MENETLALQSLEEVAQMAEEMENNYKEKIEILTLQVEDASGMMERYIQENETLTEEIQDLKTALEKHAEWNKLSMALYILLFVYGLVYGAYAKSHEQEL